MNDEQKECSSKIWWPDIKEVAKTLEDTLNKKVNRNSFFIHLDEQKLDSALKAYERSWWIFKTYVYREDAEEEVIDRHKIASLYILSILANRPFDVVDIEKKMVRLENKNLDNRDLFLANEIFSLAVMQVLIFAWDKNKNKNIFELDGNEQKWLIILLNNIKSDLENRGVSFISGDTPNVISILSLAQVIYYIEKSYI
jgi:hypothetical protein